MTLFLLGVVCGVVCTLVVLNETRVYRATRRRGDVVVPPESSQ